MDVNQLRRLSLLMIVVLQYYSQYAYTQSGDIINFRLNTQQLPVQVQLGDNFQSSQQYSIWGWFRYQGTQPNITNLLNIQHYEVLNRSDTTIQPYPNPNYPACPYTSDEIKNIPNLASSQQVISNPNCTPTKLDTTQLPASAIKTKDQDILFINVDHNPAQGNQEETFNFVFLIQNGKKEDYSDMLIDGFVDIKELKDNWAFFAISCDYSKNIATIYLKVFNQNSNNVFQKNVLLNDNRFVLRQNSEIILAAVENNDYFDSVSGFVGQIAHIEMSSFYTNTLNSLWMGYLRPSAIGYQGILMDVNFDIYQQDNNTLTTKGRIEQQIKITGQFQPVFDVDRNKIGSRFFQGSYIELGQINYQSNESLIRSLVFFFKMQYSEPLPERFTLLEQGTQFSNGFMRISLVKVDGGRSCQIELTGDSSRRSNTYTFRADYVFQPDTLFYLVAGVAVSPSGKPRIVYADYSQSTQFNLLDDSFFFNTEPQNTFIFANNSQNRYDGHVDLYRFMMFDSASQAVQLQQRLNAIERQKFDFLDDCGLRTSIYFRADDCIECRVKVLSIQNICVNYCPEFYKNPMTYQCFPCTEQNCDEIDKTTWTVTRMAKQHYRFSPTRKILNPNYDYESKVQSFFDANKQYNYDIRKVINRDEQYIDFFFIFKDRIIDQELKFEINEDFDNRMFDQNRNLIFQGVDSIEKGINVNTITENICWMTDKKSKALKTLAAIALIFIAATAAILLVMTLFCCCGMYNMLDLWKFWIHNWMRLQLIAFLILIGIYQPCCVQEFLDTIYKYAVSWDQAFYRVINRNNWGSEDFREGILQPFPEAFRRNSISPFLLQNILVFLIVQGSILFIYIILKVWDCIVSASANCFYKVFVFFEFTMLIIGYILVHMQAFTFSFINFEYMKWGHGFFIISFLFAIGYLAVYVLFWLFSFFKLIGDLVSFQDLQVRDKYYYFFAGYKDSKWARTWDHWMTFTHLIIALMIGILNKYPLAQTIVILCMMLFLLAMTIVLRPWVYGIFTICECIAQVLIIVVICLMLAIAAFDHRKCYVCGDREGGFCWAIVILLFIAIILPLLALIFQTIMSFFKRNDVENVKIDEEEMVKLKNGTKITEKVYTENVNVRNVSFDETNQNMTMAQFMQGIRDQGAHNMDLVGRSPNELAPDSVDEEYNMPRIMQALTANQSFNSELEESRAEMENREYQFLRNKQNFYENRANSDDNLNDGFNYDNDRVRTSHVLNSRTTKFDQVRKSF